MGNKSKCLRIFITEAEPSCNCFVEFAQGFLQVTRKVTDYFWGRIAWRLAITCGTILLRSQRLLFTHLTAETENMYKVGSYLIDVFHDVFWGGVVLV